MKNNSMKNSGMKSTGIKGALRAYQIVWKMDKLIILLLFPSAVLRAVKPYVALLATSFILQGFADGYRFQTLLSIALTAVGAGFLIDLAVQYLTKVQETHNDVYIPDIYLTQSEKYLTMDYQLLESPAVNDISERIARDNRWGSGYYNLSYYLSGLLDNVFGFLIGGAMIIPFFAADGLRGGLVFLILLLSVAAASSLINSKAVQARLTAHLNSKDPKYDTKYQFYFIYGCLISSLLKTARIYNCRPLISGYLNEDERRQNEFCKVFTKYSSLSGFLGALTNGILTAGAYLFVVAKAVTGAVSVSNVVRYAGTIYNMADSFFGLSSSFTSLINQTDRIQSMIEFMEIKNVLYKGTLPVEKRDDNEYEIEFKDVSFRYPGSEEYSLRHFSISLRVGQKLAVVGMNGSGKTTMIKLLCRLYDPTEGEITLNGINIKKYNYKEYMELFSVVFQDFKLLSFQLSENIACSTTADPEKLSKVIQKVGMSERIEVMDQGYQTYLYHDFDQGIEISGGEAQKIALARALYKDAPFIVLDEPTAALDPIAEYEIYSKFNSIVDGKTAVYISHRLSSCRFCDDIAVFEGGQIVQRGSHDELVADKDGKYYELWSAQAQYYTE